MRLSFRSPPRSGPGDSRIEREGGLSWGTPTAAARLRIRLKSLRLYHSAQIVKLYGGLDKYAKNIRMCSAFRIITVSLYWVYEIGCWDVMRRHLPIMSEYSMTEHLGKHLASLGKRVFLFHMITVAPSAA